MNPADRGESKKGVLTGWEGSEMKEGGLQTVSRFYGGIPLDRGRTGEKNHSTKEEQVDRGENTRG